MCVRVTKLFGLRHLLSPMEEAVLPAEPLAADAHPPDADGTVQVQVREVHGAVVRGGAGGQPEGAAAAALRLVGGRAERGGVRVARGGARDRPGSTTTGLGLICRGGGGSNSG